MENNKDHTQWQFVGMGFMVAFIVMVFLWWNEREAVNDDQIVIKALTRNWTRTQAQLEASDKEDDSLRNRCDSLERAKWVGGPGVVITGDGTDGNPYVITSGSGVTIADTSTVKIFGMAHDSTAWDSSKGKIINLRGYH